MNSLGETMGIPPTETFNKVLCKSDEGEDVKKKMYNWWRAVFEVLSSADVPKESMGEYNQKVEDLMAEILRAGSEEAPAPEPVTEDYEHASMEEETGLLDDMEFAIQYLGEIANKVQTLVNFVNPWCKSEFNEGIDMGMDFQVGDVVKVVGKGLASRGWAGIVKKVNRKSKWPYIVKFHKREDGEYAPDELELVEKVNEDLTNKEVNTTMKVNEMKGGDEWVSMDDIIGMRVGESDVESHDGSEFWKAMDDVDRLEKQGYWSGAFKVGDKVNWIDPETDEITEGWTVIDAPEDDGVEDPDAIYVIANDETGSEAEVMASELRPANMNESEFANELEKGDDGWREIGQPVGEATVVVDADTVWDVLELLDDDAANQNLTDLINSHVRTEEEIMDAIENILGAAGYSDGVPKSALNGIFSPDNIHELIEELGLDVDAFMDKGEIVDKNKPVTLEDTTEKKPDEVEPDNKTFKDDEGQKQELVTGEEKMSDAEAAKIMGSASATDMDAADIGVSSQKVADPYNKKPVCEMTIEQEIDDPWKLSEMLWSQGKENLQDLLRSELVGEEDIMMMLEDSELRNLTSINDAFAFDFPSILDSLGLDGEAWSQNLEFKRKGDDSED